MIYFVTGNKGKFEEAKGLIEDLVQKNIGYTEIQADSLEEVASFGIKEVVSRISAPVMLEDAGIFIDELNGFPGVYSAYVFSTIGNVGILRLMDGASNRNASFHSVVCYSEPGRQPLLFKGDLRGTITTAPRGDKGFGYDPIFEVNGETLGEMSLDEKNRISHRSASIRALKEWLSKSTLNR